MTRHQGRRDQAARARLAPLIASGRAVCWRCAQPIDPAEPWDAGHLDDLALGGDPAGERQPEHRACNRSAGAQLGRNLTARRRLRPTRFLGGPLNRGQTSVPFSPTGTPPPAPAPRKSFVENFVFRPPAWRKSFRRNFVSRRRIRISLAENLFSPCRIGGLLFTINGERA